MVLELIPPELQGGIIVSVQQMACGDPGCAPIDTIINLTWQEGLSKPIKVGLEAHQVDYPDLQEALPPVEVITSWSQGEDAKSPELRFANGSKVQCRTGADPVTGWAPGTIVALWYREEAWPSGTYAPYQIQLDDGRLIFGECPPALPLAIRRRPAGRYIRPIARSSNRPIAQSPPPTTPRHRHVPRPTTPPASATCHRQPTPRLRRVPPPTTPRLRHVPPSSS